MFLPPLNRVRIKIVFRESKIRLAEFEILNCDLSANNHDRLYRAGWSCVIYDLKYLLLILYLIDCFAVLL